MNAGETEQEPLSGGTTVTVAVAVLKPAVLEHVSVYVVVALGETERLPLATGVTDPIPWSIDAAVAPLEHE